MTASTIHSVSFSQQKDPLAPASSPGHVFPPHVPKAPVSGWLCAFVSLQPWANLSGWLTFHSSSSLLICCAVICRARNCSCSEGILTSHDRKHRSWIRGCHWELSQLMSFRLLWLAQGCLCRCGAREPVGTWSRRSLTSQKPAAFAHFSSGPSSQ